MKIKKKKALGIRAKRFKHWVLVLESPRKMVPTAATRRLLLQKGRVKRVEFSRGMSKQVKSTLIKSFPKLRLRNPFFMKCDSTKHLSLDDDLDGFPSREEIIQIASKESMYILEEPEDVSVCMFFLNSYKNKAYHTGMQISVEVDDESDFEMKVKRRKLLERANVVLSELKV